MVFPDSCKLGKLKPPFKKGSRIDPSNYRALSLLPLNSKIFEKVLHDQTIYYLAQYDILYKYQFSFGSNHSTNWCLSYLNDNILKSFDNDLLTL